MCQHYGTLERVTFGVNRCLPRSLCVVIFRHYNDLVGCAAFNTGKFATVVHSTPRSEHGWWSKTSILSGLGSSQLLQAGVGSVILTRGGMTSAAWDRAETLDCQTTTRTLVKINAASNVMLSMYTYCVQGTGDFSKVLTLGPPD